MEPRTTGSPPHPGTEGFWRYDLGTDAFYWWDGERYSLAARRVGSAWRYGKIGRTADRLAEGALWSAVAAVFFWFLLIPLLAAVCLAWVAARRYRRAGSPWSRQLKVAIGLIIFAVWALVFGVASLGGLPLLWWVSTWLAVAFEAV